MDFAFRYSVICNCRTLLGAGSPRGPSPRPLLRFSTAEQAASLRSPMFCPDHQRSSTGSSLLRTPPTPVMGRAASPVAGVAPPVESLLAITGLPAYPSVTSRHVAHADPAGPLVEATAVVRALPLRPSRKNESLGCRDYFFEAHICGSCVLRPACSTPCLLSTPPHGDAVGTVFGAEQPNCTDGTFTRVDAPNVKNPKTALS